MTATQQVRDQGRQMLEAGDSPHTVSEALGVSLSTVYSWKANWSDTPCGEVCTACEAPLRMRSESGLCGFCEAEGVPA
jgi:uncharacterized protein YjcR